MVHACELGFPARFTTQSWSQIYVACQKGSSLPPYQKWVADGAVFTGQLKASAPSLLGMLGKEAQGQSSVPTVRQRVQRSLVN